jgi:hypothetical protein
LLGSRGSRPELYDVARFGLAAKSFTALPCGAEDRFVSAKGRRQRSTFCSRWPFGTVHHALLLDRRVLLAKLCDLPLELFEAAEELFPLGLHELAPVLEEIEQQERDHANGTRQKTGP